MSLFLFPKKGKKFHSAQTLILEGSADLPPLPVLRSSCSSHQLTSADLPMADFPTIPPTYPLEWEVESEGKMGGSRLPSMEDVAISYASYLQGVAPESASMVPESESFIDSTESMVPETESFVDSTPTPGSVEEWSPPSLTRPLMAPIPGSVEEAIFYNFAQFEAEKYMKIRWYFGVHRR